MKTNNHSLALLLIFFIAGCSHALKPEKGAASQEFPRELVEFVPYKANPLFEGTGTDTWDKRIRERGYILFENGIYKMWYTGYKEHTDPKYLGYATSKDGINWERYAGNPIVNDKWTEDVFVVKNDGIYYMYAEGANDFPHLLTSTNGIDWKKEGDLVVRKANGDTITSVLGTTTVWIENGKWYLFYENNDEAIFLAQSTDHITWTNIQDEPVLKRGPGSYDKGSIAANQIIKYKQRYYMYYHASEGVINNRMVWNSSIAMSEDLIHWKKYQGNPIIEDNQSSPITVFDGKKYRLYTMHNKVDLHLPK